MFWMKKRKKIIDEEKPAIELFNEFLVMLGSAKGTTFGRKLKMMTKFFEQHLDMKIKFEKITK